jgi:RNA polymerase subunit RPABC4/transcription elongation factor Spt4
MIPPQCRLVALGLVAMDNNILLFVAVYLGVVFAVLWLALAIWAYRDMRARSRDPLAQVLVAVLVLILNIPGALIYMLLRPRETLSEAYERSLEEEALLQEIEEKPTCPGCGGRIQGEWQACPQCHTRLKKACYHCGKTLELSWTLCPYCTAPQAQSAEIGGTITDLSRSTYAPSTAAGTTARARRRAEAASTASALEFVEGDEY